MGQARRKLLAGQMGSGPATGLPRELGQDQLTEAAAATLRNGAGSDRSGS
jgi:hypothetical protein